MLHQHRHRHHRIAAGVAEVELLLRNRTTSRIHPGVVCGHYPRTKVAMADNAAVDRHRQEVVEDCRQTRVAEVEDDDHRRSDHSHHAVPVGADRHGKGPGCMMVDGELGSRHLAGRANATGEQNTRRRHPGGMESVKELGSPT